MSDKKRSPVLVIGLGRFGSSVATTLEEMGHEVLATDIDERVVKEHAGALTQVIEMDCTETNCIKRIGGKSFETAVVAIGGSIEASLLAVLALVDLGVPNIWAKATNDGHAKLLERTGAHHVVFPEQRMGQQVAHMVNERLLDFISFGDEFAIARLKVVVDLAKDEQVDVERLFWVKLGAKYLHELLGIAIFEDLQLLRDRQAR